MRKLLFFVLLGLSLPAAAERVLSLEDCRRLALDNNKTLQAGKLGREVALNQRKAARTNYLPKVDAIGNYTFTSREVSLLNKDQKAALSSLGTGMVNDAATLVQNLVAGGILSPAEAQKLGGLMQKFGSTVGQAGDALGQSIRDAFRTDTRNLFVGAAVVRQPIFMGGAISAENKMADVQERMADNNVNLLRQQTLYAIDQAYWTAVSLRQKQRLVESYRDLVAKLNDDVQKMIREGIATRSDGLKVKVKQNEVEMQLLKVADGLTLSKMLLCQLCGLPLDEAVTLADETADVAVANELTMPNDSNKNVAETLNNQRPELLLLQDAVDLLEQNVRLTRSLYLPHVIALGGYAVSNPNLYNGFQKTFGGAFNVGISVQVPVWNWMSGRYRVRGAKTGVAIAKLNLMDATEKLSLQASQARFRMQEARKQLVMAESNKASADENLRSANLGFREGVMSITDVMEAQTAWQQAHTGEIDARIQLRLSEVELRKAMGALE